MDEDTKLKLNSINDAVSKINFSAIKEQEQLASAQINPSVDNLSSVQPNQVDDNLSPNKEGPTDDNALYKQQRVEKKRTPVSRINALTAEKHQLAQERDMYAHRALALEQETEQLRQLAAKNEEVAHQSYEHQLNVKIAAVQEKLYEARLAGDWDAEVQAEKLLNEFKEDKIVYRNEQAIQKAFQQYGPARQAQPTYDDYNYQQPAPATQFTPDYEEFLEENPWLDSRDPEYDHELSDVAYGLSVKEAKKHKMMGRSDYVGTKGFFNDVKKQVMQQYGIDSEKSRPQNSTYRNVAPVDYRNPSYGQAMGQPDDVRLTPDQIKMANGFTKLFNPATGKKYTEREAILEWSGQAKRFNQFNDERD